MIILGNLLRTEHKNVTPTNKWYKNTFDNSNW